MKEDSSKIQGFIDAEVPDKYVGLPLVDIAFHELPVHLDIDDYVKVKNNFEIAFPVYLLLNGTRVINNQYIDDDSDVTIACKIDVKAWCQDNNIACCVPCWIEGYDTYAKKSILTDSSEYVLDFIEAYSEYTRGRSVQPSTEQKGEAQIVRIFVPGRGGYEYFLHNPYVSIEKLDDLSSAQFLKLIYLMEQSLGEDAFEEPLSILQDWHLYNMTKYGITPENNK